MTSWTTAVCDINGASIHYVRTGGAKPPVVLLHGLTGSGACWAPVARALEAQHDVVMPDARGHGRSSAPRAGYRYEDHANDVVGLLRGLGLGRPVLVGHSMGGLTAALVASCAGAVLRGLVLVDPTFLSPERQLEVYESDVTEQHRRLLSTDKSDVLAQLRARHPRRSSEIIELLAEARLQTRINAFDVLMPPNPDYRQLASAIDVPSLLVLGGAGAVVSPEIAAELQSLNPRLRVEQISDAGHGLPYDQPERLAAVASGFLNSVAES